ncbi:hypothetical protein OCF84_20580 (plasmid) [Shewanella xiamenensis]|uniref:Lipoprotein n=1 Tax=Shewanella xiamenensis TaxID=332186 RepID=A0ABT6UFU0_9GAMM|nr:hypothetical protein [Shewanella xiamenensis]MDI5833334.1 hypothetical protein [Shewanella xiamenensis]WHF57914.1 hypothetical protein OCF84_20580 [Shewanella xiamenensis]
MNLKILLIAVTFSPLTYAADSCSPQQQHQSKFEKYVMEDVPSLLESCGLGLSIKLPSFSVPSLGDLFCGYSAGDLADWYNSNTTKSKSKLSVANASAASTYKRSVPSTSSLPSMAGSSNKVADSGEKAIRELQTLSDESDTSTANDPAASQSQWEPASLFKKQ